VSAFMPNDELDRLAGRWRDRYGERAKGGITSLEGYRFQLLVAIRDSVQAFLHDKNGAPSVFVERVSDICQRMPSDGLLFTQVKLTGHTVSSALAELWDIHVLATAADLPGLQQMCRYRILCSQWTLKDVHGAIDRWRPPYEADPDVLIEFKDRVEACTDPSPMDELLDLVANKLNAEKPLTTILSWLGRFTRLPQRAEDFWQDLRDLSRDGAARQNTDLYLWSAADRPPPPMLGPVLLNDRPKLVHLRQGYFADRPLYASLTDATGNLLESITSSRDVGQGAQIIWIGGRSGCGKSVALLHVLARLHEKGVGPIIWLRNRVDLLGEAIRWIPHLAREDQTVIIAVDDPYAPNTQGDESAWRRALSELESLQDRGRIRMPVLLCCGPKEQSARLTQDFGGDVSVQMLPFNADLDDQAQLKAWFRVRTGHEPAETGKGDLLPVQLFFEWSTGPIKAFAKRFRKRLLELDSSRKVYEIVCRILAANRMYTGYHYAALESGLLPTQRDAFEILIREHHFALDEDPDRGGVWLTHPQLANAMFEAWLPPIENERVRRSIIVQVILDGLDFGQSPRDQTALLWALARHARSDGHVRQRMDDDRPSEILHAAYSAWRQRVGVPLPFSHLPAWITLQYNIAGLTLEPAPISEAISRLLPEHRDQIGFRLTCHKILEFWTSLTPSERDAAGAGMLGVLMSSSDWYEWRFIVIDMILKTENLEARGLVESHLRENAADSHHILSGLLVRTGSGASIDWLMNCTIKWLDPNITMRHAGAVLSAALMRRDLGLQAMPVSSHAISWIQHFSPDVAIERVLRRLLRQPHSPMVRQMVVGLALDYLDKTGVTPTSGFVLGPLLRPQLLHKVGNKVIGQETVAARALALGLKWMSQFPGDPGIPYVADQLLLLPLKSLSDEEWIHIATASLSRLAVHPKQRDADYSLISIARRRHLLDEQSQSQYSAMLRAYLDKLTSKIDSMLTKARFREALKPLAASLPLSAHLGDEALMTRFECKAREFRQLAPKALKETFDHLILRLRSNQTWPNRAEANSSLQRVEVFNDVTNLLAKLNAYLRKRDAVADEDEDIKADVEEAYTFALQAIESRDFKTAGFLLEKALPLADRIEMRAPEQCAQRLFGAEEFPIEGKCEFALGCDRLIEGEAWASIDRAISSLERASVETPRALMRLIECESFSDLSRLHRSMKFCDCLMDVSPTRAGLFLAPLFVLATRSNDAVLSDRVQRLARRFLDNTSVSDAMKVRLANRLHELWHGQMPANVSAILEALGLQTAWVEADACTDAIVPPDTLKRHLETVRGFAQAGMPIRASHLVAPVLFLAARANDDALLEEAIACAEGLIRASTVSPESLDGFIKKLSSYRWTDEEIRERVFVHVGLGSPMLWSLLAQTPPAASAEILGRSLVACERQLAESWFRGPAHILVAALPLASWMEDDSFLRRCLELARRLLSHPDLNQRKKDHFRKLSLKRLAADRWRSREIGCAALREIGVSDGNDESLVE
jgi:hypothetical protein